MKFNSRTLVAIVLVFCLLTSPLTINAASLSVKDAWIINNNENVLALSDNGDLYFGEDVYSQNKDLVLNSVSDVYASGTRVVFVLLKTGEILKIDVQYISSKEQFKNNIDTIKNVKAKKFLQTYPGEECLLFINNNNELILLDKYEKIFKVSDGVKEAYADRGKVTILTNDDILRPYERCIVNAAPYDKRLNEINRSAF